MSGSAQMCSGIEFHAGGPACKKARSPNLVWSCSIQTRSTPMPLWQDSDFVTAVLRMLQLIKISVC